MSGTPEPSAAAGALDERPVAEYGVLVATFATLFSVGAGAARRRGRLPERVGAADIALGGISVHKLSRLVSRDRVAAPVRAPFTRPEPSARDEIDERPRGHGLRRALGELVLCPFCLSQWFSAAFVLGLTFAPRMTRLVGATLSVTAVSDFLQVAWKAAENRREPQR